ncbi:ParB N-terminal domain-containing protein, partial [Acidithiobacillus ferrooxidans F221]
MAKVDLSENLFDEMKRTLAEMAGDSGETAAKADRLPGRRLPGQEAARADERNAVAGGTVDRGKVSALFLALSEIEPDPEQPRKTFVASGAQDAIDNDLELLKESILQHGVLQPIAVHPVASGRY